jgi:hypothetical protein
MEILDDIIKKNAEEMNDFYIIKKINLKEKQLIETIENKIIPNFDDKLILGIEIFLIFKENEYRSDDNFFKAIDKMNYYLETKCNFRLPAPLCVKQDWIDTKDSNLYKIKLTFYRDINSIKKENYLKRKEIRLKSKVK